MAGIQRILGHLPVGIAEHLLAFQLLQTVDFVIYIIIIDLSTV